jgi:hypothetical protein
MIPNPLLNLLLNFSKMIKPWASKPKIFIFIYLTELTKTKNEFKEVNLKNKKKIIKPFLIPSS